MAEHDPSIHRFRRPGDREELARLKRLTGLDFTEVPASLLGEPEPDDDPREPAAPAPRVNAPRG